MQFWQIIILGLIGAYSVLGFFLGFKNTYYRKNPYGLCPLFGPLGAFVWCDIVVFGVFFFLTALLSFLFQNFLIFLLVYSVFWVVRSIGEQVYWFLEQFAVTHRNPPKTLNMSRFFPGESVWIYQQIFWQCISVIAIISSVFLFSKLI